MIDDSEYTLSRLPSCPTNQDHLTVWNLLFVVTSVLCRCVIRYLLWTRQMLTQLGPAYGSVGRMVLVLTFQLLLGVFAVWAGVSMVRLLIGAAGRG